MKGTETQKPPPLLLVLEAEEEGILRLASLSLTFKVTAWLPLLPGFAAMASSRHKKREGKRESKGAEKGDCSALAKNPSRATAIYWFQKGPKRMGRERDGLF